MNNYFRVNNKNGYRLDTVDSLARSLSRIHHGYHVQNNQLKSETWDYLVREGYLLANDIPDDQNTVALNLANFFKQTEKSSINTDRIGRRYFGYKRALRDPEKYLVKYLVYFIESGLIDSVFHVHEKHFDRSHRPITSPVVREEWSGCAFIRRRSMFVIVSEKNYGTPRSYTLHSPQNEDGIAMQILGDSIESVENWGSISSNKSSIILDIVPEHMTDKEAELQCDIMSRYFSEAHIPHVAKYIFGE